MNNPTYSTKTYDINAEIAENRLKPLLTDEFLETLLLSARTFGWSGDFSEIHDFVNWCNVLAGKDYYPLLEPIDYNKGSE